MGPIQRVAVLVVLVALVAAACGGDDADSGDSDQITAEFLTGTWLGTGCACRVVFAEDGTYQIKQGATVEQGNFALEGTILTFVTGDDSRNCDVGDRLISTVEVIEDGASGADRFRQVQVEDDCMIRGSVDSVTLERVP